MTNGNKNVVTAEQMRKKKLEHDLKRSYDSILKEAEDKATEAITKARHITLEYYVPLLCERLRVEKYKDIDPVSSDVKEIVKMQNHIRTTVINDCYWWDSESIRHYWPVWAKEQYYVDLGKAGSEARKEKLVEKALAKEAELSEEREKEFSMLTYLLQRVKGPIPEEQQESRGFGPRLSENEPATPQELYEDAVQQ